MVKLYLPSNGTEGEYFLSLWCEKCSKDTYCRGGTIQCNILTNSMIGKQPKQWIYDDNNKPYCTSFKAIGSNKVKKKRVNKNQLNLF